MLKIKLFWFNWGWVITILLAVLVVCLLLNWPKEDKVSPVVATPAEPVFIYLDTAAKRANRRADSLQLVANAAQIKWQAAEIDLQKQKTITREAENFLTDVRNNAVIGRMSMAEAADYLLRFIYNNKGYSGK